MTKLTKKKMTKMTKFDKNEKNWGKVQVNQEQQQLIDF